MAIKTNAELSFARPLGRRHELMNETVIHLTVYNARLEKD